MFIGYIQCCTEWQSRTPSSVGSLLIPGPPTHSITSDFTSRSGARTALRHQPPLISFVISWFLWKKGWFLLGELSAPSLRKNRANCEWEFWTLGEQESQSYSWVNTKTEITKGYLCSTHCSGRQTQNQWTSVQGDKGWKVFWRKISFWPPVETPAGPKTTHFSMLSFKEGLSCYFSLRCRIKGTKNSNCHQKAWEKWIYNVNSICFLCLHIHHVIKRICRLFPERRQLC